MLFSFIFIYDGSGVLSEATLKKVEEMLPNLMEGTDHKSVREINEEEKSRLHKDIKICAEKEKLITVYDPKFESDDLNAAILKAQLTVKSPQKEAVVDQLRLALIWNDFQFAKENIFGNREQNLTQTDLSVLFPFAMVHDRVEFVKAFLEIGFDIRKYLSEEEMVFLYNNVSSLKCNHFLID